MDKQPHTEPEEILSRREYREILLARMAGGDLYANELLMSVRKADMALDRLRIAFGEKPLYPVNKTWPPLVLPSEPKQKQP